MAIIPTFPTVAAVLVALTRRMTQPFVTDAVTKTIQIPLARFGLNAETTHLGAGLVASAIIVPCACIYASLIVGADAAWVTVFIL